MSAELVSQSGRPGEAVTLARRTAASVDSALASRPTDIERARQASAAHLVLGDASARAGDSAAASATWNRALALATLPSAARQTEFLALQARALLRLHDRARAEPVLQELSRRHVALPSIAAAPRDTRAPSP
jgi:hypothetical protein